MDYNMIGTAWSLLPPIVAIALALKTKEVYSSLFIGIILGAVEYCISMGTGLDGFLVHLTNHTVIEGDETKGYGLIHCLSDPWNVGILIFLVLLGSIVSLMNKAGGSAAFGRWASKHVKTKMGVQIATILLGILIFIDDYFNCLTVGSVMRPIAVRNGVTKEKLAYLIDSTAAPVCIISPISSWAAAVSGFVSGGENGLALFCKAIPFNFYAFFTILFMFGIVWLDFDFKAMSKYDARLKEWYERTNGGKLDEVSGTKLHIVSLLGYHLLCLFGNLEMESQVFYSLDQSFQVEVDDALDGIEIQLVEGDDVIETVQKLWSKLLAQTLLDDAAGILLVFLIHRQSAFYTCRSKADASAEIFQLAGSCIRGHDDDGVAEVDESAVAIGKSAFVEYL